MSELGPRAGLSRETEEEGRSELLRAVDLPQDPIEGSESGLDETLRGGDLFRVVTRDQAHQNVRIHRAHAWS